MQYGPVELVVLTFPGDHADAGVVEAISDAVSKGDVTVLDLVFLTRTADSRVRLTDADEDLATVGFGELEVHAQALISEHDIDAVRDALEPGFSAVVIVFEETWARKVASAVRSAGGAVALQAALDPGVVSAAVAAAAVDE